MLINEVVCPPLVLEKALHEESLRSLSCFCHVPSCCLLIFRLHNFCSCKIQTVNMGILGAVRL